MTINGAEVLARSLIANGITHAFNVPGIGIHPLLDALKRHRNSIRYFTAPNETAVSLMADGYGRVTGRPAFVNVYHASGNALGMMGVTTAWADRSPMVFTTTTSSRRLARRDQYAAVPGDITETTRQFTKWSWEVPMAARIPEAIARAVIMATTPPMGPVHLAFPMDIYLEEFADDAAIAAPMARPERLRAYAASAADPAGIAAAAALLHGARRPLIVAGGDVAQLDAVGEMVELAEMLGAAVMGEPYVAYMGFPNTHPLFCGRFSPASPLVAQADAILAVGAEFSETGAGVTLPPAATPVVFLTTDARDLGKQIWADVGLVGHPKTSLGALIAAVRALGGGADRGAWQRLVADRQAEYRAQLAAESAKGRDAAPVRLPRLIAEVQKVFGDEAIIMDHSTTGTACLLQMYDFPDPRRYFGISARASAQGWGMPAAIGMQIGAPDRRVIAFLGDGGFMFTSTALYAAALWNTRIIFIVLKNGGWYDVAYGARKNRGWTDEDVRAFGWSGEPAIDYAGLARSLGIASVAIDAPDALAPALLAARAATGPILLVVDTDRQAVEYYLSFIRR